MTERRPLRTELAPDARTMARGAAVNVGGALLTTALSFALSLLITHEIRATSFGLYSIALVTVLLGAGARRRSAWTSAPSASSRCGPRRATSRAPARACRRRSGSCRSSSGALAALLYWQAPWLRGVVLPQAGGDRPDPDRRARAAGPGADPRRDRRPAGARRDALLRARQPDPRSATNIAVAVPVLLLGYGAKGLAGAFLAVSWSTLAVAVASCWAARCRGPSCPRIAQLPACGRCCASRCRRR